MMAFTEIPLTNAAYRKMIHGQAVKLTCTLGSTGAAVAYLLPNWTIVVVLAAALHANNVVITTPIPFRVVHVTTIQNIANASTVIISNGGSDITGTITLGANKAIVKATEIDDDNYEFEIDDDDLTLEVGGAALTGIAILDLIPILT